MLSPMAAPDLSAFDNPRYTSPGDGPRIATYDLGGDGPDLLLVHATGFCAGVWGPVAALLDDFRVTALDVRGHGRSAAPDVHGRREVVWRTQLLFDSFPDFTIKYVQRYSELSQPLFYKLASYWGGLDGSIMFWVFLLSLFGAAAVYINREKHRELIPYVVATLSVVQMFFLFVMIGHNNPFATYLTQAPPAGEGLNPLLQNFYMAIHPPTMYLGFVGLTVPYAFGIAALITGHLDDSWLRAVRRWTMIAWFFLSFGLTLGMIWAYEELGWGGFWGWDPVENAGLLPWFTATAFLHSVMVQERRGMLRVWNVTLVIAGGVTACCADTVAQLQAFAVRPRLPVLRGRVPGHQAAVGEVQDAIGRFVFALASHPFGCRADIHTLLRRLALTAKLRPCFCTRHR